MYRGLLGLNWIKWLTACPRLTDWPANFQPVLGIQNSAQYCSICHHLFCYFHFFLKFFFLLVPPFCFVLSSMPLCRNFWLIVVTLDTRYTDFRLVFTSRTIIFFSPSHLPFLLIFHPRHYLGYFFSAISFLNLWKYLNRKICERRVLFRGPIFVLSPLHGQWSKLRSQIIYANDFFELRLECLKPPDLTNGMVLTEIWLHTLK